MPGPADAPPPKPPAVVARKPQAAPTEAEVASAHEVLRRAAQAQGAAGGRAFSSYVPAPDGAEPGYRKRTKAQRNEEHLADLVKGKVQP